MIKDKLFYSLNSYLLEDEMRAEMERRKTQYTRKNTILDCLATVVGIVAVVIAIAIVISLVGGIN